MRDGRICLIPLYPPLLSFVCSFPFCVTRSFPDVFEPLSTRLILSLVFFTSIPFFLYTALVFEHIPNWNTHSRDVAVFHEISYIPTCSLLYCFFLRLCRVKFKDGVLRFPHTHHCPVWRLTVCLVLSLALLSFWVQCYPWCSGALLD